MKLIIFNNILSQKILKKKLKISIIIKKKTNKNFLLIKFYKNNKNLKFFIKLYS
jgi:hypothetical protein